MSVGECRQVAKVHQVARVVDDQQGRATMSKVSLFYLVPATLGRREKSARAGLKRQQAWDV